MWLAEQSAPVKRQLLKIINRRYDKSVMRFDRTASWPGEYPVIARFSRPAKQPLWVWWACLYRILRRETPPLTSTSSTVNAGKGTARASAGPHRWPQTYCICWRVASRYAHCHRLRAGPSESSSSAGQQDDGDVLEGRWARRDLWAGADGSRVNTQAMSSLGVVLDAQCWLDAAMESKPLSPVTGGARRGQAGQSTRLSNDPAHPVSRKNGAQIHGNWRTCSAAIWTGSP